LGGGGEQILVSADTDFGTLLARRAASHPSRLSAGRKPKFQAALLLENLPQIAEDLERGCVVVFEDDRVRIRQLHLFQRD